jgi:hypothetical protein
LPNERGGLPFARVRQAGNRSVRMIKTPAHSPALARLVKRSPNELLCGTSSLNLL